MPNLIELLKKATEPDRDLDLAILNLGAPKPWVWLDRERETITSNRYGEGALGNPVTSLERYTESLDDALTLIPAGSAWAVSHGDPDPEGYPQPFRATVMPPLNTQTADATDWHVTPAIALCIAALKVRTAHQQSQRTETK